MKGEEREETELAATRVSYTRMRPVSLRPLATRNWETGDKRGERKEIAGMKTFLKI